MKLSIRIHALNLKALAIQKFNINVAFWVILIDLKSNDFTSHILLFSADFILSGVSKYDSKINVCLKMKYCRKPKRIV